MRHENDCACGRRKVAGAIACTSCYSDARKRREETERAIQQQADAALIATIAAVVVS